MDLKEKIELVRLLEAYRANLWDKMLEEGGYVHGTKAQHEHARSIIAKLSLEIEKGISVYA